MPINRIQFQKRLSLQQCPHLHGTEDERGVLLFRYWWPHDFIYPKCSNKHYYRRTIWVLYQCCSCRFQSSIISGTIFYSTKLKLTIWFLSIYFIIQSNDGISSFNLSRCLGISANTALRLKYKIPQLIKEKEDSFPLDDIIQFDGAYWDGKRHGGVRGRGATGKTPINTVVSTNLKGHPEKNRLSRMASFKVKHIRCWAVKRIHRHSLVLSDGLSGLGGIANPGIFHNKIVTGDGHESMKIKAFIWINTMLCDVIRSLHGHGTYHAVSKNIFSVTWQSFAIGLIVVFVWII